MAVRSAENEAMRQSITTWQQTICENASAAQMQAKGNLTNHLRSLIDRADTSDLEFICKDEVRVRAYRGFLVGRSPTFEKMLTNGMLETTSSTINLPEITSASLLSILEFLYTGDILHYVPKDWRTGLEVMSAAHFFFLSDVDRIVQKYLATEIAGVVTNSRQIAIMLTIAMSFKNLSPDKDIILSQLVRLLESKWTDSDLACSLSEEALDFILRHTKPAKEHRAISSLSEYFRFRGVILWCVCNNQFASFGEQANQLVNGITPPAAPLVETKELVNGSTSSANEVENGVTLSVEASGLVRGAAPPVQTNKCLKRTMSSAEAIKIVNGAIPPTREELYRQGVRELSPMDVTWLPNGIHAQASIINFFSSHQASKEAAVRLLVHVDWVRIPGALFVKVIEPLKLIHDSKLMKIFRFHSLHGAMPMELNWLSNETYAVHNKGFVIQRVKLDNGSAICQLTNRLSDDLCVWRFNVEKFADDIQLGFICGEDIEEAARTWDYNTWCFAALGASGVDKGFMSRVAHWFKLSDHCVGGLSFKHGQGGRLDGFWRSEVTHFGQVEFRYHRTERRCEVTVDTKNFGTMWTNLSGRNVFPVVFLGGHNLGCVRLAIVSGFELL